MHCDHDNFKLKRRPNPPDQEVPHFYFVRDHLKSETIPHQMKRNNNNAKSVSWLNEWRSYSSHIESIPTRTANGAEILAKEKNLHSRMVGSLENKKIFRHPRRCGDSFRLICMYRYKEAAVSGWIQRRLKEFNYIGCTVWSSIGRLLCLNYRQLCLVSY